MALQHVMKCPKCGFVHSVDASAGVGLTKSEGRMSEPSKRGDHNRAIAELSRPGPRTVTDGPRSYPPHIVGRDGGYKV